MNCVLSSRLIGALCVSLATGLLGCAEGAEFLGGASGAGGAGGDDASSTPSSAETTTSSDATSATATGATTNNSSATTSATTGATTAAATTSTASTTVSSGSLGTCDNQGICQDPIDPNIGCVACAFEDPCFIEYTICTFDIECLDFADCIGFCASNDQACFDSCAAAYPFGASEYNDLAYCAICLACYNDCDGAASGC